VRRDQRGRESAEAVVVCGAGAAGMAAALAAARAGADVWLLEARPQLGGTVTHALIHTLGGLYDSAGEFLNGGLAQELAQALTRADASVRRRRIGRAWVLSVCPDLYRAVVGRWLEAEQRIMVLLRTRVTGVVREADRAVEVEALGPGGAVRLRARAVIDATGTGEVVRHIDPTLVQDDQQRAAGGLIFTLRGVAPGTLAFPRGLGVVRALHAAAADGTLPPDCGKAWVDAGVREDEVYVKLLVPLPADPCDREKRGDIMRQALSTQAAVVSFLRRLPAFAAATVARTGSLGVRDGGRVCGEYCLSVADVRQARKFTDAACRCCWPIEYWDPDRGVSLEYLPDSDHYEIPLRSLKVQGLRNVWAAGKCLSADRHAQASARVVGSCWSMGEAVGKAAAGP
jgi:hypothetical protein